MAKRYDVRRLMSEIGGIGVEALAKRLGLPARTVYRWTSTIDSASPSPLARSAMERLRKEHREQTQGARAETSTEPKRRAPAPSQDGRVWLDRGDDGGDEMTGSIALPFSAGRGVER